MKKSFLMTILLLQFWAFLMSQEKRPIVNTKSSIAFTINEKDLFPESIAYDPQAKQFFIGSISKEKVVAIDKSGKQTDFIQPRQDGMLRSFRFPDLVFSTIRNIGIYGNHLEICGKMKMT